MTPSSLERSFLFEVIQSEDGQIRRAYDHISVYGNLAEGKCDLAHYASTLGKSMIIKGKYVEGKGIFALSTQGAGE